MEAITIPSSISGSAIVADVCDHIADRLFRDCNLRHDDRYSGYSARVVIELQLHDVYPVEVNSEIQVGSLDPAQPIRRITLGSAASADEVEEAPPPLERLPEGELPLPVARSGKRYYTPRGSRPRGF